ncbi:two-component sensor histidine kinase [Fictibacillus nanhaiensis]|uniref:sensor histidine kinase n=1 Tax=Fictibacillus nanhaiensis TaxID=742169 RepID=UPI001C982029|nr:histidine kinase [Fictibacillus nanhaiensis]MBY6037725.1 two-component sensor histidine kinase [Fictibacillus nanhaiensis]
MTYKQIKWLILLLPTISVGLWEYLRHTVLANYISMSSGNWLSAVIVFLVTLFLLNILFGKLERMQNELQRERSEKAVLEERGNIAKELHDGIAQSLFFLSVQVNKLNKNSNHSHYEKMKKTLQHIHDDTRSAIQNLRTQSAITGITWTSSLHQFFDEIENVHSIKIHREWNLSEEELTIKEKVELFSCVKEAIINVIKHAETDSVWVSTKREKTGWFCEVLDKGRGFSNDQKREGFGLKILEDRASSMGWEFSIKSVKGETVIRIQKEEEAA